MQYEWPGKLIYCPENGTITWSRELANNLTIQQNELRIERERKQQENKMAKEQRHKKEVKKPKKEKHMDVKEDAAMLKAKVKKGCLK